MHDVPHDQRNERARDRRSRPDPHREPPDACGWSDSQHARLSRRLDCESAEHQARRPYAAKHIAIRRSERVAGLFGELEMRASIYARRSSQLKCCSVRRPQRTGRSVATSPAKSAETADATAWNFFG